MMKCMSDILQVSVNMDKQSKISTPYILEHLDQLSPLVVTKLSVPNLAFRSRTPPTRIPNRGILGPRRPCMRAHRCFVRLRGLTRSYLRFSS